MSSSNDLFRPIGDIAVNTDAQPEVDDDDVRLQDDQPQFELREGEEREVQQMESLCMECGEQGVTRMLLTVIPYFKEVILMSFKCEHCGNSNTEIQSAGEIQPKGCIHTVHVLARADLDRQIVKSPTCTITIPEFYLTVPASRGQLTNIEGLIRDTARDLAMDQPVRKLMDPETHAKIEALVTKLTDVLEDDEADEQSTASPRWAKGQKPLPPFTIKLDDPAGNSFIQFLGSVSDPKWSMRAYSRTREQNASLGLVAEDDGAKAAAASRSAAAASEARMAAHSASSAGGAQPDVDHVISGPLNPLDPSIIPEEVFNFPGACSSCGHEIMTLMQRINIPHFKDIIIMSTNCDHCGYRDNEVKSGGAISAQGKKIILKVEDEEDLSRDLLKSETCGLEIPEIDLLLHPGTLGGRFTTLEGMLNQVYDELSTKVFQTGDSSRLGDKERTEFGKFLGGLKDVMTAARPFTLILDDPVANSYLQNIYAPDPDPNMEIIIYDRTFEQNEELGINDMVLEGYEQDEHKAAKNPKLDAVPA